MPCVCLTNPQAGNDVYGIPLKDGFPMSTACERAGITGSIPEVFQYPGFTLVARAAVTNRISSAGIANLASFFTPREGCYYRQSARLPGCC